MPLQHHPVGSTKGSPRSPLGITSFLLLPHQAGAGSHQSCRSNPSCWYQCLAHARDWTSHPASSPVPLSPQYHHIQPKSFPPGTGDFHPSSSTSLLFSSHQGFSSLSSPLGTSYIPSHPTVSTGTSPSLPSSTDPHQGSLGSPEGHSSVAGICWDPGTTRSKESRGKHRKKKKKSKKKSWS